MVSGHELSVHLQYIFKVLNGFSKAHTLSNKNARFCSGAGVHPVYFTQVQRLLAQPSYTKRSVACYVLTDWVGLEPEVQVAASVTDTLNAHLVDPYVVPYEVGGVWGVRVFVCYSES